MKNNTDSLYVIDIDEVNSFSEKLAKEYDEKLLSPMMKRYLGPGLNFRNNRKNIINRVSLMQDKIKEILLSDYDVPVDKRKDIIKNAITEFKWSDSDSWGIVSTQLDEKLLEKDQNIIDYIHNKLSEKINIKTEDTILLHSHINHSNLKSNLSNKIKSNSSDVLKHKKNLRI